ncbi:hypothetical protein AALI21_08060 [Corynebacteriaceae bacterium 6-324]
MGLTLDINDFKRIIKMPLMIIVGTIAHYVIMPLLAVFLCWVFHLDGMLAVGVILVCCCSSGTSSNVMSLVLLQTRVFVENGGSGTSVALHTNK